MDKRFPGTLAVAGAIGRVTFLEIVKDKVLYNIILCAFLLFGVGFLAARLTYIRPERVILDFGLSALTVSSAMIAIFTGASQLVREVERRTIHVALSRPISRWQFLLGKFAGITGVVAVNWALLSLVYILVLAGASGDGFREVIGPVFFIALGLVLVQSVVVASVAILFSTFSTTSLSVILTIGVYLIGNNITELHAVAARMRSPGVGRLVSALATALPDLEHFNLGARVTYGMSVPGSLVLVAVAYGLVLTSVLLLLGGILIGKREV